jgi:hypothetical protein
VSSEERKRMQEVADWLNADEGYLWARFNFEPVKYGRPGASDEAAGSYGLYGLKTLDLDVSGSAADFSVRMDWGGLPGDDQLFDEHLREEHAGEKECQVCL